MLLWIFGPFFFGLVFTCSFHLSVLLAPSLRRCCFCLYITIGRCFFLLDYLLGLSTPCLFLLAPSLGLPLLFVYVWIPLRAFFCMFLEIFLEFSWTVSPSVEITGTKFRHFGFFWDYLECFPLFGNWSVWSEKLVAVLAFYFLMISRWRRRVRVDDDLSYKTWVVVHSSLGPPWAICSSWPKGEADKCAW